MGRLTEMFAALGRIGCLALSLGMGLVASAACVVSSVGTSGVTSAGGGRYSVSGIAEGSTQDSRGEAHAYRAAVERARKHCNSRGGRKAKIESSSGTASSDGQRASVTDTQRIYFRCEKSKNAKRKKAKRKLAKRRRKKKDAKKSASFNTKFAEPAGGAVGSVALERWSDTATGLPFAKFRYTFEVGTVLSVVVRGQLDGSGPTHAAITIVSESHGGHEFNDESLMALEVNGTTIAALDTAWSVRTRPGRVFRETLEATFPLSNLVDSPQVLTGFAVRAGVMEASIQGDALARLQEFLAIVKSGQLAVASPARLPASKTFGTESP